MARKVIALLGTPIYTEEDKAAEAITPGHLLDWDGSGDLIKHAGAAKNAAPMFALERDELGDDIDTAYAIGDYVKVGHFTKGQRVYAWVASGYNAAKGAYLESDGAGRLRALSTDAATDDTQRVSVVGRAVEAVDNSAGPGDARLRVIIT